jgi:tetratricopeptide (TPR) repeat protein
MLPLDDSDAWQKERAAATKCAYELLQRAYEENYAEERESDYLEPLKNVEAWEAKGCPVVAEEYADVVSALRDVGRVTDAMALCDRAMAELTGPAADLASYMKGCYLLNRFDPDGLALVYRAMENNNNFVEEGLEIVGNFCCITGNAEALEIYREKAVELHQRAVDTYEKAEGLNPGDNLSAEHLPDGMLDGILAHLQASDDGKVRQVYLVRKTVSADFFATAVVLRFGDDTTDEHKQEVFHKMFRYLDTSTDWYFMLFDYDEVRGVNFNAIPGSRVYERAEASATE